MVRETAAANLQERLAENPYPGRGIVQGRSPEGDWVQVYWIMGRSDNSRNRVFVGENDLLRTEAADRARQDQGRDARREALRLTARVRLRLRLRLRVS